MRGIRQRRYGGVSHCCGPLALRARTSCAALCCTDRSDRDSPQVQRKYRVSPDATVDASDDALRRVRRCRQGELKRLTGPGFVSEVRVILAVYRLSVAALRPALERSRSRALI